MTVRLRNVFLSRWFSAILIALIGLSLYLPNLNELGYYRDDWNNIFNADSRGADMLVEHYASDRPADGYLLAAAYKVFGPDPTPYLAMNLGCRILSAIFFMLSCARIWRFPPFAAFAAGALFIVFPGYLRQVDGISYLPHQVAMLAFSASIFLSICAFDIGRITVRVVMILAAAVLSIVSMFLMEYYLGMEALRFGLIWAYGANRTDRTFSAGFRRAIFGFLPYLGGAVLFFVWRSFVFEATRSGTDLGAIFDQFQAAPKYVGATWFQKLTLNLFKLLAGSWTVPPYNGLNGINVRVFFRAFAEGLLPLGIFCAAFLGMTRERNAGSPVRPTERPERKKTRWQLQWIWIGAFSASVEVFLLIVATREITFSSSLDRFTYHAAFSAVLVLIGFIALIEGRMVKFALLSAIVLGAVLTQRVNIHRYAAQTRAETDFWWQLSWRAPDIRNGTTVLLHNSAYSPEEDYENFSPLHLIYRRRAGSPIVFSDLLNNDSIRNARMGALQKRTVRKISFIRDFSKVLAVTKPTEKSCLQVVDGRNPIYSPFDYSRIDEVGFASDPDRIVLEGAAHVPDTRFFGPEPAREWCYSYALMGAAQQRHAWADVAAIADEAIDAGYHAEDPVEWLPVVQSFAYLGREDDARGYLAILKSDPYLRFQSCQYFRRAAELLTLTESEAAGNRWLSIELCED